MLLIILPEIIIFSAHGIFNIAYGSFGILLILSFYIFRHNFQKLIIAYISLSFYNTGYLIINAAYWAGLCTWTNLWQIIKINYFSSSVFTQLFNISILPVLYRIKKLRIPNFHVNKYLFYYFYPLHIIILILIKLCLS